MSFVTFFRYSACKRGGCYIFGVFRAKMKGNGFSKLLASFSEL